MSPRAQVVVVRAGAVALAPAVVESLLGGGARIVLVGHPDDEATLHRLVPDPPDDARIVVLTGDPDSAETPRRAVESAWRRFGAFDALLDLATLTSNGRPTYLMAAEAARSLPAGASVVLTFPLCPPDAGLSAAAASGALQMLVRTFALELAAYRIRVNGICYGLIEGLDGSAERALQPAFVPLGRSGTPHEVAGVLEFLSSAEASFITGTVLTVDGGLTALSPSPRVNLDQSPAGAAPVRSTTQGEMHVTA